MLTPDTSPTDQPETTDLGHGLTLCPGKARISEQGITIHHDTADFLAVEIDMASKYVQPHVTFGDKEAPDVWLMAYDDALYLDESADRQTMLTLPEHTKGWVVLVEGGRYTIQIVAWRRPTPVDE